MRLLLGDNHVLFADMLRVYLKGRLPVATMALGTTPEELLRLANETEFDLIAVNLHMPGLSVPETLSQLGAAQPGTPIAVIADANALSQAIPCLKAGALGFIPKTLTGEAVMEALRQVLQGDEFVPEFVFDAAHEGVGGIRREPTPIYGKQLTKREFAVLQELCDGKSNKEIGRDLGIAEQTVKIHLQRIFKKMGAKNRADAVRIALHQPIGNPA